MLKSIPVEFSGNVVELRGFLRSEDVTGFVGMWMRIDGESGSLGFDSTQKLGVKGTNDWKEYSIKLPLTHEEIAQMIGSSRETVTRLFSDFRRKQLISTNGSTVVLRDVPALRAMLEQ